MHYVISDIHGCYYQYIEMLNKIHFTEEDVLIVNGDIIDRGEGSFNIIEHMIEHSNILPVMGNHEIFAIPLMESIINWDINKYSQYISENLDNSDNTIDGFKRLPEDKKRTFYKYIVGFPMYRELIVDNTNYVIVHAGFDYENFDENKPLNEYNWEDLVLEETDYSKVYYHDKILVTGHTPTYLVDTGLKGHIYKGNNHILTDCGCVYGGYLGCICLETQDEFYVDGLDVKKPIRWMV